MPKKKTTTAKTKVKKDKKVSYPTLNWCYGAYPSEINLDIIDEQYRLAHRYKNKFVKIERRRRQAADDTIRVLHPPYDEKMQVVDAAEARVQALRDDLNARRAKARRRIEPTPEEKAEFQAAKAVLKKARTAAEGAREKAYAMLSKEQAPYRVLAMQQAREQLGLPPEVEPDPNVPEGDEAEKETPGKKLRDLAKRLYLDMVSGIEIGPKGYLDAGDWVAAEAQRQARAGSALYSGTYLIAERAFKNSRKGPPPVFKRYDGSGTIGVQLAGGMSLEEAIDGKSNLLRLELPELTERMATKGKDKGRQAIGYCWLRVKSGEKRKPIWAKIPFVYSREFPKDAKIMFAVLDRKRVGTVFHWQLRFEIRTSFKRQERPDNDKRVAVHLGYRLFEQGIRVAVTLDEDGKRDELYMPNSLVGRFLYVDDLKSIQKKQFNLAQDAFWDWRKTLKAAPDWFMEASETAYAWRDTERLAQLILRWADNRFDGDTKLHPSLTLLKEWADGRAPCSSRAMQDTATAFGLFRYWTSWNRHMVDWIANQHRKPSITRDQFYRTFVRKLRSEYGVVVMAGIEWDELAKQEQPEEGITQTSAQRRTARIASPGRMSQFLKERFAGDIIEIDSPTITSTCHVCGDVQDWDHKRLMHQCTKCGATWDQDVNAVNNQFKRAISK